jgi:hypothetical protein
MATSSLSGGSFSSIGSRRPDAHGGTACSVGAVSASWKNVFYDPASSCRQPGCQDIFHGNGLYRNERFKFGSKESEEAEFADHARVRVVQNVWP